MSVVSVFGMGVARFQRHRRTPFNEDNGNARGDGEGYGGYGHGDGRGAGWHSGWQYRAGGGTGCGVPDGAGDGRWSCGDGNGLSSRAGALGITDD